MGLCFNINYMRNCEGLSRQSLLQPPTPCARPERPAADPFASGPRLAGERGVRNFKQNPTSIQSEDVLTEAADLWGIGEVVQEKDSTVKIDHQGGEVTVTADNEETIEHAGELMERAGHHRS